MLELIAISLLVLVVAVFVLMGLSIFVAYITQAEYIDEHDFDDLPYVYDPKLEKRDDA